MMEMHKRINPKRASTVLAVLLISLTGQSAWAGSLSLEDAEALAILNDPSIRVIQANQDALDENAIAAGQFPDPMVKVGMAALPTDSFNLGQEPMTQIQLGVVQKFPRGNSRSLRTEQFNERSKGLEAMAQDQSLRVILSVREEFLEVLKQQKLAAINQEAIKAFTDLADITLDYYATGRVQQQDVLRASVELAKVQDRATQIAQEEDQARARMTAWLGAAALREINADWPQLQPLSDPAEILNHLDKHPRISALNQNIVAADTGIELARQAYKPEFSVDVTYGGRGGTNMDGSSRADLLSMMLVMDVPLFTAKRQDRLVAARVAESSAAMYGRDDVYRMMRSQLEMYQSTFKRQHERIELFQTTLLPEADFNADATFEAYQAAVENLTTLMRARITEFELQLEYARLQSETLKTQARLLYLQGEL